MGDGDLEDAAGMGFFRYEFIFSCVCKHVVKTEESRNNRIICFIFFM